MRFLSTLVLTLSLGVFGFGLPSTYASTVPASAATQVKPALEHMKVFRITDGAFDAEEKWYNPTNGYSRIDHYSYYYQDEIITKKDIKSSTSKDSLFETVVKQYQYKGYWTQIGTVQINGKQVKKIKSVPNSKDHIYNIAYIDTSTGLPVKEEGYDNQNKVYVTYLYFFDRINDPTGEIFKKTKKESK